MAYHWPTGRVSVDTSRDLRRCRPDSRQGTRHKSSTTWRMPTYPYTPPSLEHGMRPGSLEQATYCITKGTHQERGNLASKNQERRNLKKIRKSTEIFMKSYKKNKVHFCCKLPQKTFFRSLRS